jgi:hypothetical protein
MNRTSRNRTLRIAKNPQYVCRVTGQMVPITFLPYFVPEWYTKLPTVLSKPGMNGGRYSALPSSGGPFSN